MGNAGDHLANVRRAYSMIIARKLTVQPTCCHIIRSHRTQAGCLCANICKYALYENGCHISVLARHSGRAGKAHLRSNAVLKMFYQKRNPYDDRNKSRRLVPQNLPCRKADLRNFCFHKILCRSIPGPRPAATPFFPEKTMARRTAATRSNMYRTSRLSILPFCH